MSGRHILADALRRQAISGDFDRRSMTVLGFPSQVKEAKRQGLIVPYGFLETPRVLNWYDLTEKGLEKAKELRKEQKDNIGDNEVLLWYNYGL